MNPGECVSDLVGLKLAAAGGIDFAVKLDRLAVKMTQPSGEVRSASQTSYERNAGQLIAATHFQTIAAANNYWRGEAFGNRSVRTFGEEGQLRPRLTRAGLRTARPI